MVLISGAGHRNLQRTLVLIGGLDEEDIVKVLEQEGV